MIARLIVVGIVFAVGLIAYRVAIRQQLGKIAQNVFTDPILQGRKLDVPTIVYFTTPMCIPCKTRQKPALLSLQAEYLDAIHVIEIDATEQPTVADRWGVMTAPTTFVLDKHGQPRDVNHGVADVNKLKQQLQALIA